MSVASPIRPTIRRRSAAAPSVLWPDDLHPVLRRVYAQRGVCTPEEVEHSLAGLLPGDDLLGLKAAVDLLSQALEEGWRILVVGDFDADGATSTALAVHALRAFGAPDVRYLVPNRFEFGYGLTPEIVEVAAGHQPDLLLTVDNGVSSVEGVAAARLRGVRVLVTDHHLPGGTLPKADAIVDPNLPGDPFPGKHLAGVGVVFYVMLALRARMRAAGRFERSGRREPNLARFLDLVALGTVADVVPLDRNNRILVEQGLRRIRAGRCLPGVQALLEVAGRNPQSVVAADLGFAVGPRLNAAGRLQDMSLGIECLLTDDAERAAVLAQELHDLNQARREIEARMQTEALQALEELQLLGGNDLPHGLCLFEPGWHQGVIGILAGRIKEQLHRPVIVFAANGSDELKGSARSVPGLHIRDTLESIASRHPRLIRKFGGHAMAAGLSLAPERLEEFRAAFDRTVREFSDGALFEAVIESDGELAPEECSLAAAEALRYGGPWGQGFGEPLFDGVFEVLDRRLVGQRHMRLRLRPPGGSQILSAIAFGIDKHPWPADCTRVHIVYRLSINEYRGARSVELVVRHANPA